MDSDIKHLINFRQSLHQNPELSGNEEFTAEALKRTIIRFHPDDIIDNIGGYGVAFIFKAKADGPTIMFRAEMDALPIHELNDLDYASRADGVGHQCGHDGHMAIMVGIAERISKNRPTKGKIVLLFQPSEETGDGAQAVIDDPNFYRISPDLCFSMHNIPGFPEGSIILKNQTFTAASQGLIVKLNGKTSHAAEPEKGISPAIAMAKIIECIHEIPEKQYLFNDFVLATVVHARLGERTFGTAPGQAEILITLRSYDDADIDILIEHTKSAIHLISNHERLEVNISFTDIYPSTQNNPKLVSMVSDITKKLKYKLITLEKPFPWAEDFAQFSQKFKSVMFGLGAGEDHPKLHNADYNFPDEIIPYGINVYDEIYKELLTK
ncbi:MAG: amidohydrolase [Salinivirgaceae bacterium]|nr:amidohydrolase [Salinivirgaceae bacterium]